MPASGCGPLFQPPPPYFGLVDEWALLASPDFLTAYEPLLRLALALRQSDPLAAQALLEELVRLVPAQPGARAAAAKP